MIGFQGLLSANLIDEGILMKSDITNACLIYQPYLGTVKDIDNLDIKSDKFQINDEKILFLDGNVAIDFPDGYSKQGLPELIRIKDSLILKKMVIYFSKIIFLEHKKEVLIKMSN